MPVGIEHGTGNNLPPPQESSALWGFVLSATVRGNAFSAKQNRLSATARIFGDLFFKPTFSIGKTLSFPKVPESESHPKPSSKHVENAWFATLFSRL